MRGIDRRAPDSGVRRLSERSWTRLGRLAIMAVCLIPALQVSEAQAADNPNFSVAVNAGEAPLDQTTVAPGEPTGIRITLSNTGTLDPITNVAFDKALPTTATGGLRVNGAAANNCGATVTVAAGQPGIQVSGAEIPAGAGPGTPGLCHIDIPIIAWSTDGASTTHTYDLDRTSVTSDQGEPSTGGSQSFTVTDVDRPTWTKSFSAGGVLVLGGSPINLTIAITNPGTQGLTNFAFEDVFPTSGTSGAIMEPTSAGTQPMTCDDGASTAPNATLTQGTGAKIAVAASAGGVIAAGDTCRIIVAVRARHTDGGVSASVTSPDRSVYRVAAQNRLVAASFTNDQGLQPASNASAAVQVRSPLTVSKQVSASRLSAGQVGTFTITLGNAGLTDLAVASFSDDPISDTLDTVGQLTPNGTITNSCGGTSSVVNARGIEWQGFTIPTGGSCTLTLEFTGTPRADNTPTTLTDTIAQGAVDVSDPTIVSPSRSASLIIADELLIEKSLLSADNVTPGSAVQYRVTLNNYSAASLTGVRVRDPLTGGATYLVDATHTPTLSAGCGTLDASGATAGSTSPTFVVQTLPARTTPTDPGVCNLDFWVTLGPTGSSSTNLIPACHVWYGGSEPPVIPDATCNGGASNEVTVTQAETLALTKTFDGSTSAQTRTEGTVVRLAIEARNYSDAALSDLAIADSFPLSGDGQQFVIADPPNLTNTCGGDVTAVKGTTSIALTGGSLAASADSSSATWTSCQIALDIVGPAGVYDNSASAEATRTNADTTTTPVSADSNTARLTYTTALTADKSFSPASAGSGGHSTVTVRLTNSGDIPLTGVSVTDPLPTGMVLSNPPNLYSTCDGTKTFAGAAGSSTVGMSGATLAANSSCELLFDVDVTGSSSWSNSIAPGGITADGNIANVEAVSATLGFTPASTPIISKSIEPGSIPPGGIALMDIRIDSGDQPLSDLSLSDYFTLDGLPGSASNGMRVASPALAETDCTGGTVTAVPGGQAVTLSGASMAADSECHIRVQITSVLVGALINRIPTNAITTAEGATNSTTSATSSVTSSIGVGVAKSFTPRVVQPGQTSRLRISFFNSAAQTLADFGVRDDLPSGLTVAPTPNVAQTCGAAATVTAASGSILINHGALAPAEGNTPTSCYLEVDVVAAASGEYVNTIPADSLTAGGTPVTHPEATDTLGVMDAVQVQTAFTDLTLDETPLPDSGFTQGTDGALPGVTRVMTIRLYNPNATPLTEIALTDALPDGLYLAPSDPALSNTCSGTSSADPSGRQVALAGGSLAAGGSCEITANVLSNTPGTYTNSIPGGAVSTLEGTTNAVGTNARLIIYSPPSVTKTFDPPVIPASGTSSLTIFVNNPNEANMVLSQDLVDTLPTAPGQVSTSGPLTTTCLDAAGTAPATVTGGSAVTLESGSQVPPGGCSIQVNVTAATTGAHNNTIPVNAIDSSFGPNQEAANATLLVSPLGYISGRVFLDKAVPLDGSWEAGVDEPLRGVRIDLQAGSGCSGAAVATVDTDAQGRYLFSGLTAGTYSVCEPTQPVLADGVTTMNGETLGGSMVGGGTPGAGTNPTDTTSQVVGIVLSDGGSAVSGSVNNDFAEIQPASIAGVVYIDTNDNAVLNTDEALRIPAVTVTLTGTDDQGDTVERTLATDSDGAYLFEGLRPGDYEVTETKPTWLEATGAQPGIAVPALGTAGSDSTTQSVSAISIDPGDALTEYNFGHLGAAVTGIIYSDGNGNGLFEGGPSGDLPLAGVEVRITDANGHVQTVTTDANGRYSAIVPPGTVTVRVDETTLGLANPSLTSNEYGQGTNSTTLLAVLGQTVSSSTGYVAGAATQALNGCIYEDRNRDGRYQPTIDRPQADVLLKITDANLGIYNLQTDESGCFSQAVAAGQATVLVSVNSITEIANPTLTTNTAGEGSNPGTKEVPAGGTATQNIGFVGDATQQTVTGTIYEDVNENGLYDGPATDRPLSEVSVVITDSIGGVYTAQTNANGFFSENVADGETRMWVNRATVTTLTNPSLTTDGNGEGHNPSTVTVPVSGTANHNTGFVSNATAQTLSFTVYQDLDRDGRYTSGADRPLAGIAVTVTDGEGSVYRVVTGSGGTITQSVAAGAATVLVDVSSIAGQLYLVSLTTNAYGQGENPSDVNVPAGGSGEGLAGFILEANGGGGGSIPTLSEWTLILLTVLMMALAAVAYRRGYR